MNDECAYGPTVCQHSYNLDQPVAFLACSDLTGPRDLFFVLFFVFLKQTNSK